MSNSPDQASAAGTSWDPTQYLKFSDHRLRPALELLDRVPPGPRERIYDLGCGAGNVTRIIAERHAGARVCGVEVSAEMVERARATPSDVEWVQADIEGWQPPEPPDLLYSNATLHWLPGHETLFPRLVETLAPGGCLAVQMPLSWGAPSHRLMRETLADGACGGGPLGDETLRRAMARKWVADADEYYDLLVERVESLDIWETEYLQVLEGDDPVLEWVKSTGLRPVLNGLDDPSRERFLDVYRARLSEAYPTRADGRTLYPFRRLFIVATR